MRDLSVQFEKVRWFLLFTGIFCLVILGALPGRSAAASRWFDSLEARLIQDGFDAELVKSIYERPEVSFDERGVAAFFVYRESTLNYEQFEKRREIEKARAYMQRHAEALEAARRTYGVGGEIITAIILVETRLGKSYGNRSVINTLSTMAALSDNRVRRHFWDGLSKTRKLSLKKFEQKAARRSDWAYRELKSFLQYTRRENADPVDIKGSFAGAVGIAQFMPSNILRLARDGNGDGKVDLFNHADAIHSIANYLKHHGWKEGLSRQKAYKVVLRYNYSKYYANTILDVRSLLKG